MRNNKNGLDEMQKEKRDSIGNQSFMLLAYGLFLDIALHGAGIRWLDYPANVMVIITVCLSIYLVRLIAANAYLPPKALGRKSIVSLLMAIAFSVVLSFALVKLNWKPSAQIAETANDHSALILVIASAVGLLITVVVAIIKKVHNDKDNTAE